MAYDPKDPKDVKIVEDLVAAGVAEAVEEATAGLKTKNTELIGKVKALQKKVDAASPEDAAELSTKLEAAQAELATVQASLKKVTKERDTAAATAKTEGDYARNLLIDGGLTDALVKANVATQFLPAVKAMLMPKASIKVEGENRTVVVGDKALSDFVTAWSQSDEGKHYVAAPNNGGSNAPGGQGKPGAKTMKRADFDAMTDPAARAAFFKDGGSLTDA